ncbi:MAG: replication-associated recombination protein A [Leptospiraceae bacterium]|nr:replication-associated recombination protein A [Leptospiraceae bacterium]
MSLFENKTQTFAIRLRPLSWENVLGQSKTISILSKLKRPISLILYGDTGTGKTTIARILSKTWNLNYFYANAVSSGVKEIKDIIANAEKMGSVLLFLDEIHRFSSSQQDSLLDAVENGRVVLIGATTENPAFRVNRALLSRTQVFKLDKLNETDLKELYLRARKEFEIKEIEDKALIRLIHASTGDARKFLNLLELLSSLDSNEEVFSLEIVEEILESRVIEYDNGKEAHYDTISAFIKSIRGSDPDAALFYLAIMLEGGEDPIFIMRRLLISASEDVGNASVYGIILANAALGILERIGMPEGRIILAQVTTFLASSPKSNASYLSLASATEFVNNHPESLEIPKHLRNAPTFLHKKDGNSLGYKYPHDFTDAFLLENYFPDNLKDLPPQFYFPSERGTEKILKDRLKNLWGKAGKKKYDS